jgi:hypothetical protein
MFIFYRFFLIFLVLLKALEDELDKIKIHGQEGVSRPAQFIFELLSKCNINLTNKDHFLDILNRILQYLGTQPSNPRHHNGASLGIFYDFLQVFFFT